MECPSCNTNFHPQMWNFPIGLNKDNKQMYVYYQVCPSCKDAIVGVKVPKEGQSFCYIWMRIGASGYQITTTTA